MRASAAARQPVPLRRGALSSLPAGIRAPGYDVSAVRPGIVHLGLGGFHRAHMARYTHELMERDPEALGWGIVGAVLLPSDRRMIESLAPQDGLYTLIEREGAQEHVRVIGSLARVVFAGESPAELLDVLDDGAIRIVSLTVTSTRRRRGWTPVTSSSAPTSPHLRGREARSASSSRRCAGAAMPDCRPSPS